MNEKKIPPLAPSITEFNRYEKRDGKWYEPGMIDPNGATPMVEVSETVVAKAVHQSNQTRKRQEQGKLRKYAYKEAERIASIIAGRDLPKTPLPFDVKVSAPHPELGTISITGKYVLTDYNPPIATGGRARATCKSRGASKAYGNAKREYKFSIELPTQ